MKIRAIKPLPSWRWLVGDLKIDKIKYNELKAGGDVTVTKKDAEILADWCEVVDDKEEKEVENKDGGGVNNVNGDHSIDPT